MFMPVDEKKTVMIVDDDPHIVQLVKDTLGAAVYTVVSAHSGFEALQTVQSQKIDLLIVDLMLGGQMDGHELCQHLKKNKETERVPVMILSAKNAMDDKLQAVHSGAVDYMSKPFVPEELVKRVRLNLHLHF